MKNVIELINLNIRQIKFELIGKLISIQILLINNIIEKKIYYIIS